MRYEHLVDNKQFSSAYNKLSNVDQQFEEL